MLVLQIWLRAIHGYMLLCELFWSAIGRVLASHPKKGIDLHIFALTKEEDFNIWPKIK